MVKGATISVAEKQLDRTQNPSSSDSWGNALVRYEQGDIVGGNVVRIERDGILVDVGGKSEGFVPVKEISNMPVEHR